MPCRLARCRSTQDLRLFGPRPGTSGVHCLSTIEISAPGPPRPQGKILRQQIVLMETGSRSRGVSFPGCWRPAARERRDALFFWGLSPAAHTTLIHSYIRLLLSITHTYLHLHTYKHACRLTSCTHRMMYVYACLHMSLMRDAMLCYTRFRPRRSEPVWSLAASSSSS